MSLGNLLGLAALILSAYILWQIRQTLLLIFAAVVLATALNRLVRRLQKSGTKRAPTVLLSIGILLVAFASFFWLIVPPFADQFQQLIELVPVGLNQVDRWIIALEERLPNRIARNLPDIDNSIRQLQPLTNRVLRESIAFFSTSLAVLFKFLLVLVLTSMLLADPQAYRGAFTQLFPAFYRQRANEILDQCEVALGGWLVGIFINMSVITLLSWIGLLVLQIPLALAHGFLAGLLTFIPNIGPVLSVVPPIAIALIDAPWKAIVVLVLYVAIQQFESHLLTPYVMSQQILLLPAVTLLAQIAFATFFGFLGLVLGLPLLVVTQVWFQEAIVKDILDRWRSPRDEKRAELVDAVVEATRDPVVTKPVSSKSE